MSENPLFPVVRGAGDLGSGVLEAMFASDVVREKLSR